MTDLTTTQATQLSALLADTSQSVDQRTLSYYQALGSYGIAYGNVAASVVSGTSFAGVYANDFLTTYETTHGGILAPNTLSDIRLQLAQADLSARIQFGADLTGTQVDAYHDFVYSQNGVSPHGWILDRPLQVLGEQGWSALVNGGASGMALVVSAMGMLATNPTGDFAGEVKALNAQLWFKELGATGVSALAAALQSSNDVSGLVVTPDSNGFFHFSIGLDDGSTSFTISPNGQMTEAVVQTADSTTTTKFDNSGKATSAEVDFADGGYTETMYSADDHTTWWYTTDIFNDADQRIGQTVVNRDGTSTVISIDPNTDKPILTTHLDEDGKPSGNILGLNATYAQLVTAVADTLATQLISTVLLRDNLPGSIAASAFAHAAIQSSLAPSPVDFKEAFSASVFNIAGGIAGSKVGNEIALALGLPSELGSIGGSAVGQYLALQAASELGVDLTAGGVTPFNFQANLVGAAAGYLSSQLANLITPTTEAGQISGAVASTIVLILAEINPVTAPFAFFAAIFGSNFIGTMIGDLIDSIFGGQPSVGPNASAVMQYNATTNQFEWKYDTHDNGGDPAQVNAMSDAVNGIMNQTLTAIGGHATSFVQDMSLIWFQDQYYFDFNDHYGEPYQDVFDNPTDAISAATFQWLRALRVQDGDPYMEYVLRHSDATTLTGLLTDLTAARDYSLYAQDPFAFNLGLALANDPDKFAAWQAELERAQELKLDKLSTAELDGLKQYGNLTLDDLPHYGTVIGAATDFLGEHGKTYFVRSASGGVSAYQFDERAGVLTKVTGLQNANATPLNIADGTVVIASNHLTNGNYQLILEDHSTNSHSNQPLKVQTFDAQGKATGAATALTYADGAAFSYAQTPIPEFGSDAYWSMWQSNLRQIGYTGPFDGVTPMSWFQTTFGVPLDNHSAAGMQQLRDHIHSVPGALLNGHVVGTANNMLGSGGFDLIAADNAGHIRIHEFNAQGQAVQELNLNYGGASPFSLPPALPVDLWQNMPTYNSDGFWAVWQDLMWKAGYRNEFDSKEPAAWYARTFHAYLDENSPASMWQLYDRLAYPGGPQLIGSAHNLTGTNTYELIIRADDGTVSLDSFNAQGQALAHTVLRNAADGSVHYYEPGTHLLGTSHNLLGTGGYDIVFQMPDGQVLVDEYNSLGQLASGNSQPLTAGQQYTAFALSIGPAPAAPPPPDPLLASNATLALTADASVLGNNDTITVADHLNVGLLGSNNTVTLGTDDTLTVYRGSSNTANTSGNSIHTGSNVGLTVNGGGNDIVSDDGAAITVQGNGVFGTTNTVNLSNGTLHLANDARADLTGTDNIVQAGQYDALSLIDGGSNTVTIGDNGYVAITNSDGNTVTAGQNLSVGVTGGNDNTLSLGANATAWLTDTVGGTINATGANIYAYQNVQVTLNGGANHVSAADGDVISIKGNGQFGDSNFITMSNATLKLENDAAATLTGDGNTVQGGNTDLLSIEYGDGNTATLGDNSGAAINHSNGNTLTAGANALVGINSADNNTLNLGTNATLWLTDTAGGTINASNAFVYAYNDVNVTINGSNNNIGAMGGDTITVGGNGQWGTSNLVYMSGGTLNLLHDANAAITGSNNVVNADTTDLVTVNGDHNNLSFGSYGLAWIQSGYGTVIHATGAGILIGDDVLGTSIIGNGNAIYTGDDDNLNISGTGSAVFGSGSTIYLNADAVNTYIEGNNDIIHVRAGSVYQLVGTNNTVIVDTVIDVDNGDTLAHYNGLSDLLEFDEIPFDSSMTVTAQFNGTQTAGDVILNSHGVAVATVHLDSIQNFESFTVRSNGAGGTLIVDPPSEADQQAAQEMQQELLADDAFHFRVENFLDKTKVLDGNSAATVGITEDGRFDFSAFAQEAAHRDLPIFDEFRDAALPLTEGGNSSPAAHDGGFPLGTLEALRPSELPQLQALANHHHDLLL